MWETLFLDFCGANSNKAPVWCSILFPGMLHHRPSCCWAFGQCLNAAAKQDVSEEQCEWELGGIRECSTDIQESTACFAKPDLGGK